MSAPLPGHPIPYHFTDPEIQTFLARHAGDATLSAYLWAKYPPWGIIIHEDYGDILVWFDATGRLTVTDVTNMNIARMVLQAPYVSPDSDFFTNLSKEFDSLFSMRTFQLAEMAVLLLGALFIVRELRP